jgi:hypothetical protein
MFMVSTFSIRETIPFMTEWSPIAPISRGGNPTRQWFGSSGSVRDHCGERIYYALKIIPAILHRNDYGILVKRIRDGSGPSPELYFQRALPFPLPESRSAA